MAASKTHRRNTKGLNPAALGSTKRAALLGRGPEESAAAEVRYANHFRESLSASDCHEQRAETDLRQTRVRRLWCGCVTKAKPVARPLRYREHDLRARAADDRTTHKMPSVLPTVGRQHLNYAGEVDDGQLHRLLRVTFRDDCVREADGGLTSLSLCCEGACRPAATTSNTTPKATSTTAVATSRGIHSRRPGRVKCLIRTCPERGRPSANTGKA